MIGRKRGADVLRPVSAEHPDDETFEGMLILRPEGRLFFVKAQQSSASRSGRWSPRHAPRVLVLDMSRVPDIEYSALQIDGRGRETLAEHGVTLWLAGLNPNVLEDVRHAGFDRQLGAERMFFNARAALAASSGAAVLRAQRCRRRLKGDRPWPRSNPRWEWRSFGERFGAAEAHIALLSPTGVQESDELYLLSGGGRERQGARCA